MYPLTGIHSSNQLGQGAPGRLTWGGAKFRGGGRFILSDDPRTVSTIVGEVAGGKFSKVGQSTIGARWGMRTGDAAAGNAASGEGVVKIGTVRTTAFETAVRGSATKLKHPRKLAAH